MIKPMSKAMSMVQAPGPLCGNYSSTLPRVAFTNLRPVPTGMPQMRSMGSNPFLLRRYGLLRLACNDNVAPRLRQMRPTGKSILIFRIRVKPENQKYSSVHVGQISFTTPPVPPKRGACARHERAVGCGGRRVTKTSVVLAYGEVVWVGRPNAGV